MFSNLKFSKEPILWLTALVVGAQALIDWLDGGEYDASSWYTKILIAVGALIGRQLVTPTSKIPESVPEVPPQPTPRSTK